MNAIITETRASYEEFITYADADVFFDKGWLKETFEIFKNWKYALKNFLLFLQKYPLNRF